MFAIPGILVVIGFYLLSLSVSFAVMATTKAHRSTASNPVTKRNQPGRVATARTGNAVFPGIATAVPYNPRVRQLMPVLTTIQPAKVIILNVKPKLEKVSSQPLTQKAAAAKEMFAKYRKSH